MKFPMALESPANEKKEAAKKPSKPAKKVPPPAKKGKQPTGMNSAMGQGFLQAMLQKKGLKA